ncbi:MAG TPA: multicopper oxidase domain-containing protein [Nitrososphaeraceae archaeon]|nr:multicopper oxidase domain-containing protein [Nitrososphaeraceae archaeon]
MNLSSNALTSESPISQQAYDKLKNCTTDLSKRSSPIEYLTYFNCGHVSKATSGQIVRQFTLIVQENQKIPITYEGHIFDGWTFNGTIPGPTMRVTEGDLVRIRVINVNENKHAHSLYTQFENFGKRGTPMKAELPGSSISRGKSYTYEFVAGAYGLYPYYCQVEPAADHINRGLYGMIIIDPKEPRPRMNEMIMLLNGYDLDLDLEGPINLPPMDMQNVQINTNNSNSSIKSDQAKANEKNSHIERRVNEIYTVNGRAFDFMMNPIVLQTGEPYRIYVLNMLEFDPVNSIHVHGAMFDWYSSGTSETPDFLNDIVTLTEGDRGIMEFTYLYPGTYMFHAHQALFTDLGWMGLFDVRGNPVEPSSVNPT